MASESETTTTVETPTASPAMVKAWEAYQKAEGQVAVMFDKLRIVAKTEAAKAKWTKKQLTAALLTMAGMDKFRASECAGWVFPNNVANRNLLDSVAEFNSKQTDLKKRIGKDEVLAIQRSETPRDEKTAEDVLATIAKAKEAAKPATGATGATDATSASGQTREARPPGSEVQPHGDGTASKAAAAANGAPAQTGRTVEEQLHDLIAAALNFAKANNYDLADFHAEVDVVAPMVKIDGSEELASAETEAKE